MGDRPGSEEGNGKLGDYLWNYADYVVVKARIHG